MRRDVIKTAPGRKTDAALEAGLADQPAVGLLEALTHIHEFDARFDEGLSVVPDLAVNL